jgi:DNA polymerase elongation subunit (family B)
MSFKYKQDVKSKSDAQIAEAVIKSELKKKNKNKKLYPPKMKEGTTFRYKSPDYIKFQNDNLKELLHKLESHEFELDGKGSIKNFPLNVSIGDMKYQVGIGGLHSTEKSQTIIPDSNQVLIDKDVAAYYPSIILNLKLFPKHLGPVFLNVYKKIVDERLRAKKEKNKVVNESLKIVINGSFGKLASKWSVLYSPDLMMMVTLTGQLALLMLIERLEEYQDIQVVSANTDGFVTLIRGSGYSEYEDICFDWELETGFELEETRYKALYSRDVNNYLAIKEDGEAKGKGVFTLDEISKNPSADISVIAVKEFLMNDIPIVSTIEECQDVTKFLTVRSVTGGATWKNEYLGRVVRWIYSTDGKEIRYKKANEKTGNHSTVAKSEGARPIMELGKFPEDIDYDRYIEEAEDILESVGMGL